MQKVIDELKTGKLYYDDEPEMLANLKREFPPLGVGTVAAFAGKVGYEYFWHKVGASVIYYATFAQDGCRLRIAESFSASA